MFLLAIALPMQGFAAATMISCGLGQHDHAHAHAHAAGQDHHAVSDSRGDAMPEAHLGDAGRHETGADHSHAGKTGLAKVSLHTCSACASCCVGAAVPSQPISFASVKQTDSFAPLGTCSVAAYVTEGLERPPRAFLA